MILAHAAANDSSAGRTRRAARIVLAEDDADVRVLVADALRSDGHLVQEVADGGALLVRIAHQFRWYQPEDRADLFVSDVRMPVITGLAILRGLRNAHNQTPFLLITAFGDPSTRREAQSLGAVLVEKPLCLADLRDEVSRLLSEAGPAPP
jgi:CheY-like chemotaxis protein